MRVFEPGRVLQAVPNRTIDADVREPDQPELNGCLGVGDHTDRSESDRKHVRMRGVVDRRSDARPEYVPRDRQVGDQDERDQEPPGVVGMKVESDRGNGDSDSFGAEEHPRESTDHEAIVALFVQASR
jgi:hypothetical protein